MPSDGIGTHESFDPADAFFNSFSEEEQKQGDPPEPEEGDPGPDPSHRPDHTPGESDPDDAEVEWGEGDGKSKAKIRELKEAFGKRSEYERLHTETTALREKASLDNMRATTALNKALSAAEKRWEPYSKIDFLALSRDPTVDQETFKQIRSDAQAALDEYNTLRSDLDTHVKADRDAAAAKTQEEGRKAFQELTDPKNGIPGFDQKMYQELMDYAVERGAPQAGIRALTAPWAFKVLHKAMLHDKGAKSAAEKVQKVVNAPSRVLKPGVATNNTAASSDYRSAMSNLKKLGNLDAAAAAFEASFSRE